MMYLELSLANLKEHVQNYLRNRKHMLLMIFLYKKLLLAQRSWFLNRLCITTEEAALGACLFNCASVLA